MSNPHKLQVGQKLWCVPNDRGFKRPSCEVEVTRLGRRWADLNGHHGRVDMETLWLDGRGYSPPGRCFLSQEHYVKRQAARKSWRELEKALCFSSPPENVSAEMIAEARKLLGFGKTA